MSKQSLDEILEYLQKKDYLLQQNELLPDRIKAKAAIVEAVEGLIGPDEKPWVRRTAYENSLEPKAVGRNELRAELRQAIKEWQRGAIVTTVQDDLRQCLRELARLGYPAVALEKKYKVNITEDEI